MYNNKTNMEQNKNMKTNLRELPSVENANADAKKHLELEKEKGVNNFWFNSEKNEEFAENLNKCTWGLSVEPLVGSLEAPKAINELSFAEILYRFLGKDHFVFDPDEKIWIQETAGVYSEKKEDEVKKIVSNLLGKAVYCLFGDEAKAAPKVSKIFNSTSRNKVFEELKCYFSGESKSAVPDGFSVFGGRAYDFKKKIYLDSVPFEWRCQLDLPEPAEKASEKWEKFIHAMCGQEGKISLKKYFGSLLFGKNSTKKIVLLEGEADSGKSQVTKVIDLLMNNVGTLRAAHLDSRFEIGRIANKDLLVAPDVHSEQFKMGADSLKSLVGDDKLSVEKKGVNSSKYIQGVKHVIVGSNEPVEIPMGGGKKAWLSRLIRIPCKVGYSTQINCFAEKLVETESAGIIKWIMDGVQLFIEDVEKTGNFTITEDQLQLVEELLGENEMDPSKIAKTFVKVSPEPTKYFTLSQLLQILECESIAQPSNISLGGAIKAHFGVTSKTKRIDGKPTKVYFGLELVKTMKDFR